MSINKDLTPVTLLFYLKHGVVAIIPGNKLIARFLFQNVVQGRDFGKIIFA
jgi:hypothetical protein